MWYGEVKRTSDDSVVTPRGKRLIEEMNRVGLWLINGYGAKAGSTFANSGGESCIDLVWCSAQEEARRGCTEWGDAVCMISDHALVMVETECTTQIERTREERKQGWRRIASAGWTSERDNRWVEWCIKQRHGTIQETWSEWKMTFNQQATRWIGKNKSRKTNRWKGAWDEELHSWSRRKNWKWRQGLEHKLEKREIRRRKRILKRRRRKEMMPRLRELKSRDPKRYWNRVQRLMGKVSKGMPRVGVQRCECAGRQRNGSMDGHVPGTRGDTN